MADNARVGELRGRPDQPPSSGDRPRAPAPPSDSNNDPRAIRQAWRESEAFAPGVEVRYVTDRDADTGPASARPFHTSKDRPAPEAKPDAPDGPTHRAPDIEPPSGEDLLESDAPRRGDRFRKRMAEKYGDTSDAFDKVGEIITGVSGRPTGHAEVRPSKPVLENPTPYGVDGSQILAAMFAGGMLLGETVRWTYRKTFESKESVHGRDR